MISVVAVFNDLEILGRRLLSSLKNQTVDFEILTVDNREGCFHNAAAALNSGAKRAQGDWVLFAHQDVSLLSPDWLSKAEEMLRSNMPQAWVGVAGMSESGHFRGLLRDSAMLRGQPFIGLTEVQTLDEVLLIHRRHSENQSYFDEQVPGWHAYGVDACCDSIQAGRKNYVIPLPIWHDSKRTNWDGLTEAHQYVWQKHGSAFAQIHTTCGVLPGSNRSAQRQGSNVRQRMIRRLRATGLRMLGFQEAYLKWYEETLESFTEHMAVVDCLHQAASQEPIEAGAFAALPNSTRRIIHRFSGLEFDELFSDVVVISMDLAPQLHDHYDLLDRLRNTVRCLLVCIDIRDARLNRTLWRELLRRSTSPRLTTHFDESRIAILPISCH